MPRKKERVICKLKCSIQKQWDRKEPRVRFQRDKYAVCVSMWFWTLIDISTNRLHVVPPTA